jgi:uncharacterized membrane protein
MEKKKETITEAKPNIFCHTCRLVMKAMSWGLKHRHLKKNNKKIIIRVNYVLLLRANGVLSYNKFVTVKYLSLFVFLNFVTRNLILYISCYQ